MTSKYYVSNHRFGYGKVYEAKTIKKIVVRNNEDLIFYINDLIDSIFSCINTNILIDNAQFKISIE